MVVFFSGLLAAANHTQQVLDGQNVLEGELVHPQRVLRLTQTPVIIPFLQCIIVAHDDLLLQVGKNRCLFITYLKSLKCSVSQRMSASAGLATVSDQD